VRAALGASLDERPAQRFHLRVVRLAARKQVVGVILAASAARDDVVNVQGAAAGPAQKQGNGALTVALECDGPSLPPCEGRCHFPASFPPPIIPKASAAAPPRGLAPKASAGGAEARRRPGTSARRAARAQACPSWRNRSRPRALTSPSSLRARALYSRHATPGRAGQSERRPRHAQARSCPRGGQARRSPSSASAPSRRTRRGYPEPLVLSEKPYRRAA
jgi:hypothetical protein